MPLKPATPHIPASTSGPTRVLIVRLSALGDVLFALPAVHAMQRARPEWEIHWVVEDKAAQLLDLVPGLGRRIVYPRRELKRGGPLHRSRALARHLAALRRDRYDLVFDFQGNLKSGVHSRLARARRRIGLPPELSREGNHWLVSEQAGPPADRLHRVDEAYAMVRAVLPELPEEPAAPALSLPQDAVSAAVASLTRLQLEAGKYAALHPGTSVFGAFKRWDPERFAALADDLFARFGIRSLVTWGPGEEDLARSVANASEHAGMAPPTRSLAELGALLQAAAIMVGSDSAPLHLASGLQTPVVALFGPKDSRKYGPRFGPARIVSTYVPCRPCTRRTCPDVLCMQEIRVRQVADACTDLLEDAGR